MDEHQRGSGEAWGHRWARGERGKAIELVRLGELAERLRAAAPHLGPSEVLEILAAVVRAGAAWPVYLLQAADAAVPVDDDTPVAGGIGQLGARFEVQPASPYGAASQADAPRCGTAGLVRILTGRSGWDAISRQRGRQPWPAWRAAIPAPHASALTAAVLRLGEAMQPASAVVATAAELLRRDTQPGRLVLGESVHPWSAYSFTAQDAAGRVVPLEPLWCLVRSLVSRVGVPEGPAVAELVRRLRADAVPLFVAMPKTWAEPVADQVFQEAFRLPPVAGPSSATFEDEDSVYIADELVGREGAIRLFAEQAAPACRPVGGSYLDALAEWSASNAPAHLLPLMPARLAMRRADAAAWWPELFPDAVGAVAAPQPAVAAAVPSAEARPLFKPVPGIPTQEEVDEDPEKAVAFLAWLAEAKAEHGTYEAVAQHAGCDRDTLWRRRVGAERHRSDPMAHLRRQMTRA